MSERQSAPRAIHLPPYNRVVLDNGLILLILSRPQLPLVVFRLVLPLGTAADPPNKGGLSYLTANLLKMGTTSKSASEIAEAIEFLGGELQTGVTHDMTTLVGEFLARDFERALALLVEILLNPTFLEEELERQRKQILAQILEIRDDPGQLADLSFSRFVFPSHPYGRAIWGNQSSITGITPKDLVDFYQRQGQPNGAILAIVGDVDPEATQQRVAKALQAWPKGISKWEPPCAPQPIRERLVYLIDKPDLTQTQIRYGNVSIPRNHPDYFPVLVANTILGGRFTSRLMEELRTNRGLTYGAHSMVNMRKQSGSFSISTYTKHATLGEVLQVIENTMLKMAQEEVQEEELESTKSYLSGLFPLRLEPLEALARQITDIEFYGLDPHFVGRYRANLFAVTPGDLKRVIQEHFALSGRVLVTLGRREEIAHQVERYGKVSTLWFENV